MSTDQSLKASPLAITLTGWLRISIRILCIHLWFLLCIPLHYSHQFLRPRKHNIWPQRFLRGVGTIAGLRIQHHGTHICPKALLLPNHISWLDIFALGGASGTAFVAHNGLAQNPLIRWLAGLNNTVFIARYQHSSVGQQAQQIRSVFEKHGIIAIFPEGTTTNGQSLLPFKSSLLSAFEPVPEGVYLQPIYLDYGPESEAIAWTGTESGLSNVLRILARTKPIRLDIHSLAPLSGPSLTNRKTMAQSAQEAVAACQAQIAMR